MTDRFRCEHPEHAWEIARSIPFRETDPPPHYDIRIIDHSGEKPVTMQIIWLDDKAPLFTVSRVEQMIEQMHDALLRWHEEHKGRQN